MSTGIPASVRRLLCLLSVAAAPFLPAATYYVSPTGDNTTGTSPATAWQTLAKVNAATFAAGDQILFESGQTFTAPANSDALIIKNAGTSDTNRITYGIYNGTAKAVIQQTTADRNGIKFAATNDWVTVQDLEIVGPHVWAANIPGAETPHGIYLQGTSSNALQGTTLQRLVVRNFKGSGIRSGRVPTALEYLSGNYTERLADTRIEHVEVYHVGDCGIRLGFDGDPQDGELRQNIYIGHCYVHHTAGFNGSNLHHGDGIQVACGKNVTVEYCVVHNTATAFGGSDGGPVGIWFADVHNGVIQFCESYGNSNGSHFVDGGGIDIDGGSLDCIVQYCYTHDNDGPGYLLAHWGTAGGSPSDGTYCSPTSRNTFRYNISVNDSKAALQGALSFWSRDPAATLDNRAYNNLIVQTKTNRSNDCITRETGFGTAANPLRAYNNIFIISNGNLFTNTASSTSFIMRNNLWWALDGNFNYDGHTLATVDADGLQQDPLITTPASLLTAPTVGFANIDTMPAFLATHFKVLSGSPTINSGANLANATYGSLSVGTRDFFGATLPQNGAYDIGHHEFVSGSTNGQLALASSVASGAEGTSLTITVTRTGGATGPASVFVQSQNGTATAGSDFTAVSTTLNWSNGDATDKTVSIPLTDDADIEGNELFTVVLSNATGATLGTPATLTATLVDNDTPPSGPVEVIVDNTDGPATVTITGSWTTSTGNPGYVGTNYVHDGNAGKGAKSVRFTPNLPSAGTYEVYVRSPAWASAANNAPVAITHVGGTANTTVNQRINGGAWVLVGTHTFNSGTAGYVTISNTGTTNHVFADAVKFAKEGSAGVVSFSTPAPTVSEADGSVALTVSRLGATDGPATVDYVTVDDTATAGADYTAVTGTLSWTAGDATTRTITVPLLADSLTESNETFDVALFDATGDTLGTPDIATVTVENHAPVEVIVDNTDGPTTVTITGSWTTSTGNSGYVGTNYVHDGNTGKGTKSVRFTPNLPSAGTYEVYVRSPAWASATNSAPVAITHAGGTANTTVNQRINGGAWVLVGTHTFNAGTGGYVTISNTGTTHHVFADAVKFVKP